MLPTLHQACQGQQGSNYMDGTRILVFKYALQQGVIHPKDSKSLSQEQLLPAVSITVKVNKSHKQKFWNPSRLLVYLTPHSGGEVASTNIMGSLYTATPELARLRAGPFLAEPLQHWALRAENSGDIKFPHIHSTHNTNTVTTLNALRGVNSLAPSYASTILMELLERKGGLVMRWSYRQLADQCNNAPMHQCRPMQQCTDSDFTPLHMERLSLDYGKKSKVESAIYMASTTRLSRARHVPASSPYCSPGITRAHSSKLTAHSPYPWTSQCPLQP